MEVVLPCSIVIMTVVTYNPKRFLSFHGPDRLLCAILALYYFSPLSGLLSRGAGGGLSGGLFVRLGGCGLGLRPSNALAGVGGGGGTFLYYLLMVYLCEI